MPLLKEEGAGHQMVVVPEGDPASRQEGWDSPTEVGSVAPLMAPAMSGESRSRRKGYRKLIPLAILGAIGLVVGGVYSWPLTRASAPASATTTPTSMALDQVTSPPPTLPPTEAPAAAWSQSPSGTATASPTPSPSAVPSSPPAYSFSLTFKDQEGYEQLVIGSIHKSQIVSYAALPNECRIGHSTTSKARFRVTPLRFDVRDATKNGFSSGDRSIATVEFVVGSAYTSRGIICGGRYAVSYESLKVGGRQDYWVIEEGEAPTPSNPTPGFPADTGIKMRGPLGADSTQCKKARGIAISSGGNGRYDCEFSLK